MKASNVAGIFVFIVAALTLSASPCGAATPAQAQAAFQKIRSLVGQWSGKDEQGNSVKTEFAPIAASTAVMETLTMPKDDMVTIYSMDVDSIALVHYCPVNNQPRMRAIPRTGNVKQLTFTFTGVGNLPNLQMGHERKLVMDFDDRNHLTERWTWRQAGKDTQMVFHFVRMHPPRR